MRSNTRWVPVSAVFAPGGIEKLMGELAAVPETQANVLLFTQRLIRLQQLGERELHEEKITGTEMTVDTVVDIFNKVNSGGTKLSKGDLALAKICAADPSARMRMREHLERWSAHGYDFSLDWLLRNVTAVVTGRSVFSALAEVTGSQFNAGLIRTSNHVERFLQTVQSRLGRITTVCSWVATASPSSPGSSSSRAATSSTRRTRTKSFSGTSRRLSEAVTLDRSKPS